MNDRIPDLGIHTAKEVAVYWTELLHKCILFKDLDDDELKKILSITKEVRYKKGEMIFKKDDPDDSLYLILDGAVRISIEIGGEKEVLTVLNRGFHFGEMALIDNVPRSATVEAVEHSKLLRIRKANFDRVLESDIDIELKVLRSMTQAFTNRIRDIDKNLTHLRISLHQEYLSPAAETEKRS